MRTLLVILILICLVFLPVAGSVEAASNFQESSPTPLPVMPVNTVTPNADGSITHVVDYGQSLYAIAVAYGMTVNELKALNNLASDDIYVGEKLIIRLAFTATPETPTTPTLPPTRTPRPTRTSTVKPPTKTPTPIQATATPAPVVTSTPDTRTGLGDPLLLGIIGMAVVGMMLMGVGSVMKRRNGRSKSE